MRDDDNRILRAGVSVDRVIAGDRRALSRAITLVESARPDHRAASCKLLAALRKANRQSLRLGLSGTPGSGKSTFIESFGTMLAERGKRIAVLAVDPTSTRSGGSILGDKTRMESLSRHANAFIRPSPSQAQLGGVSRRTREAVLVCEAAGFDIVIIETVGVGQSEVMVADMSDIFMLLLAPAGGDELQGVKRGVVEVADLILVNKADGNLAAAAERTCADYAGALRLFRKRPQDPEGFPMALKVSALENTGLGEAWERVEFLAGWRREHGHWESCRSRQARAWFSEDVREGLLAQVVARAGADDLRRNLDARVGKGDVGPEAAAAELLEAILDRIR